MAHSVVWLPEAVDDVDGIASYIAADSPAYASALVQRLLINAQSLSTFPMRGRMVPEWNEPSIREHIVGNYRMMYQVQANLVLILAVIHGARQMPNSLRDRSR